MPPTVQVIAPSRLHFGLMNFGGATARQFGGIGLMIDRPGMRLVIREAERFCASGPLAARVELFSRRWCEFHLLTELPRCEVVVENAPREHTGLGVGTQLAMSVAAGLSSFCNLPEQTPIELATSVGRGQRSAVGAYGFVLGGLIAERGKLPGEPVSPLDCHLHVPSDWCVLLVCPRDFVGLTSDEEATAFASLPPVPLNVTQQLTQIARDHLLPAAARGEFLAFADAVTEYGRLSGECFAAIQGGPYNGPRLTAIVAELMKLGVHGVGQSSWGPTIFALLPNQSAAEDLVRQLHESLSARDCDFIVSPISRRGALVTV